MTNPEFNETPVQGYHRIGACPVISFDEILTLQLRSAIISGLMRSDMTTTDFAEEDICNNNDVIQIVNPPVGGSIIAPHFHRIFCYFLKKHNIDLYQESFGAAICVTESKLSRYQENEHYITGGPYTRRPLPLAHQRRINYCLAYAKAAYEVVEELMEQLGGMDSKTVGELAEIIGLDNRTASNFFDGRGSADLVTVMKIIRAFKPDEISHYLCKIYDRFIENNPDYSNGRP